MHDDEPEIDPRLHGRLERLEDEVRAARQSHASAEADARRYRLLLDSVLDYAFITFDRDARVIGWSRGAEHILGHSEQQAMQLTTSDIFTREDVALGEDVKELVKARDEGRAEDERWHVRRDQTRFWGSGVMSSLRDEAGNLLGYSKVLRDHTARRLAEQRVRESEARLRLFTENVHDYALIPVDPNGKISGWNPGAERIFGYVEDELLGEDVACFFTPEDAANGVSDRDLQRALDNGRAEDERWMVRKNGRRFWSRWVTTPMRDDQGKLCGFAKVLHDETDRKLAADLREGAAERERQFLHHQIQWTGEVLDRTKEELRALAGSLIDAQEEERRRIARDLHDDLSQRLAALQMGITRARVTFVEPSSELTSELRRLELQAEATAQEVRRLSHRLHPAILDDLGLAAALRRLAEDFSSTREMPVRFHEHAVPDDLPTGVGGALYRVAQEALRNISKHAGRDPVQVQLVGTDDELHLIIEDAGPGFDPAAVRGRGGLGIISMQERMRLVGGSLELMSQPAESTTIIARVPWARGAP